MGLEKLSMKYDQLYEEADKLFKEHNPCQFKDGVCNRNRDDVESGKFRPEGNVVNNGCCGSTSCEYLTSEGCTIKALGCKLHICGYISMISERNKSLKEFCTKISEVEHRACEILGCDITQCFWDKEKFLNYLKSTNRYKEVQHE